MISLQLTMLYNLRTQFLGKLFKRHAYVRAFSILQYGIRQPPFSGSHRHNTPFLALTREIHRLSFSVVKEHAESTLQIVKTAFVDKKETLNEVPSISSCFHELEAALRTNDFATSSASHDRTLALENATMHHFECTHYNHHRSFTGESIFANLDSQLPLF